MNSESLLANAYGYDYYKTKSNDLEKILSIILKKIGPFEITDKEMLDSALDLQMYRRPDKFVTIVQVKGQEHG